IIPISLPNASNADQLKPDKEIILVIQENGELLFEDRVETLENIEKLVLESSKETPIHINTDKNTKFESFVEVLDMLKKNHYTNVSIVTKK
ncbi:MAG: TonB system transport protein ExbD, partial [Erysipelotrichia bacterium]|nr:TonB system transport protein ExbD [Erysipelotrichia bacterium]